MKYLTTIMYHYVRDMEKTLYPNIKGIRVRQFEEQIAYFQKFYNFVTINECLDYLNSGDDSSMPENPILLTFDDGYIDHYDNVFPILMKHNIQGVFFTPVKTIEENFVLNVNKIHFILASCPIARLLDEVKMVLVKYREEYSLKDYNYYFNKLAFKNHLDCREIIFFKRLLQLELAYELRSLIIDDLFKKHVTSDEVKFAKALYMNKSNIKKMIDSGMYFGVHGNNHFWMHELSIEQQEEEISTSLEFLSNAGMKPDNWIISYPYGAYNDDLLTLLKRLDCKLAFTTHPDVSKLSRENALTLERYDTIQFPFFGTALANEITAKIHRCNSPST